MPVSPDGDTNCSILQENLAGFGLLEYIMESLILAQNERWRRVLSMQVVRQG